MKLFDINKNVVIKIAKCCTYVVPKQKNLSKLKGFITVNLQLKKCGRGDSNSHTSRHQILSLACLPIPPRPLFQYFKNFYLSNS